MKRIAYIDQISGLLIVYMIAFHAFQFCDMWDVIHSYVMQGLSFFMFWFFYKSGMFYRGNTCKETLSRGGKLMIPFVVFSLIGHLAECVHKVAIGDFHWYNLILSPVKAILLVGAVGGNLPLWFLLSLLGVQLLYAYLRRCMRDEWIGALSFIVAYLTYSLEWHTPLYIGNVALGLLAYSMGHLLKEEQYKVSVFLISLATYIITFVVQPDGIDFRANEMSSGLYPLAVLFGLLGCVVINNLFKRLSLRIGLLEYIGIRSMKYYVMHWIVLRVCSWVFDFTGWSLFVVMLGACVIVMPLADWAITTLRQEWVFGMNVKLKNK